MTHEPEPVDLSSIDPQRDPERWRQVREATRFRVDGVLRERVRRTDPLEVLGGWTRPVLAAAAALIVLLGAAQALVTGSRGDTPGDARRLARLSESAVLRGRVPSGAEFLAALRVERSP